MYDNDKILRLHSLIQLYANQYKANYRCSLSQDDHSSATRLTYTFKPKSYTQICSEYYIRVRMNSPLVEVYIQQMYEAKRGCDAATMRKLIEDRSRAFVMYSDIPFAISAGYPDEVSAEIHDLDFEESFKKTFGMYHETLSRRLSPRLNLHMAYDNGFLEDMPYELKATIMDKIDAGHLTYHPHQLSVYGLHALGL